MNNQKGYIKAGLIAGAIGGVLALFSLASAFVPFLGCLVLPVLCVAGILIPVGAGYYAAQIAGYKKEDAGLAAKDGAIAGVIAGTIRGIVSTIVSLISFALGMTVSTGMDALQGEYSDMATTGVTAGVGIGAVLGGAVCGMVIGIVIAAGLGALGGWIKTLMDKTESTGVNESPEPPKDVEEAEVVEA